MNLQGFIGPSYLSRSPFGDQERLVNLYLEVLPGGGVGLLGTPGTFVFATLPGVGSVRALFSENGRLFALFGSSFFEVFADGSSTVYGVGLMQDDGLPGSICSNGTGGHQLFIVAGGGGFIFDLIANTLTVISAPAFPTAVMGLFSDGYFIVQMANSNQFQISALENGLSWSGLDVAQRSGASDPLTAIAITHKELWLCGEKKIEGWYNSGNASFPLQPFPGAFLEQGAIRWSVQIFDNTLAWVSRNERGGGTAYRMSGYTPTRVSTHGVEAAWATYPTILDCESLTYEEEGHVFWLLNFPTAQHTWCYDAATATQSWSERDFWNQATGLYETSRTRCHAYAFGKHLVGAKAGGFIWQQSLTTYQDAGQAVRRRRRAPVMREEHKTIFLDRVGFLIEVGAGLADTPTAAATAILRVSYDGGRTFGHDYTTTLGAVGQYLTRPAFSRLGSGTDLVIELEISDNVAVAIMEAFGDVTVGEDLMAFDLQRRGGLPVPQGPVVMADGHLTLGWGLAMQQITQLVGFLRLLVFGTIDNTGKFVPVVVATVPTLLTTQDKGYVTYLSDYNHVVQWSGTAWAFALGDPGNGYFVTVPAGTTPAGAGWHVCDGSTVPSVVLGATITAPNVTLPTVANQFYRQ